MNPTTRAAFTLLLLVLAVEPHADAAGAGWAVYVSPSGNDAWSGRSPTATGSDGPLKTLARAQALAREQLAAMAAGRTPRQAVRVEIEAGTYALSAPLRFTAADSGASGSPMVYEAVTPGTVVLSGGEVLKSTGSTAKQVSYAVPNGRVDWAAAQQLYVGGRRAVLARQPNGDANWFVTAPGGEGGTKGPFATFGASPDALAWLAGLDADDRARAVVDVYQSWTSGRHRLAGGAPAGEVRIAPAAKWPFLSVGTSQRWFVENVRAALDAPGEWFGDASGVSYLRRPEDGAAVPEAVLPQLDAVIAVDGRPVDRQWVEYLELRGLGIEHTRFLTPAAGFVDMQAAAAVGAAIEVDGARRLTIADCRFAHLGGYGVWLRANVRDSVVADNTLTDLGAGGVKVGLTSQSPGDASATGAVTVSGNTISDTGKILPGAVGIWIGQSFGNVVTKNQVSDTTYSAISVGWSWGYAPATSGRNAITNNLLFDIGQGLMSDLGGIYALGVQPGTVIRGNVIREVRGYRGYGPNRGAGAWGIYEDEGVSQTLIENNVIVGTDSGAYHLHYGHDNTLRNNLFALGKAAELRISNSDEKTNLVATDNLFVTASAEPFEVRGASDALFTGNELSPAANAPQGTRCGAGCARSGARLSLGAEPRNIALTGASPAIADMVRRTLAEAGPARPAATKARLVAAAAPAVALAPPSGLELDIAGAPAGQLPAALKYSLGGVADAIQVVSRAGAQSRGRCLQFNDGPEQKNRYDPHAFAELDHTGGTTEATFQLWIDADSDFIHEWRDAAKPYHVGPSMHISARGVESGGKVLLPITPNAWTSFRVSAKLGDGAGRWSLQVTDASGATKTVSDLADGSPAFNELQWLGFISNASVRSTACLGALKVVNHG